MDAHEQETQKGISFNADCWGSVSRKWYSVQQIALEATSKQNSVINLGLRLTVDSQMANLVACWRIAVAAKIPQSTSQVNTLWHIQ